MKKRQRLLAALTAAGMTAAAVPAVAVFADDSVAVTPSKYLQDQKGTLTMTVSGDRDVRVKIEKDTLDGVSRTTTPHWKTTVPTISRWTAVSIM